MNGTSTPQLLLPAQGEEGESYHPEITKRGVLIVLAAWIGYSLIAAAPLAASQRVPFFRALSWQAYQSAAMCALSIPVWFIVIRWMRASLWYWKAFVHIVLGPAYALASYEVLSGSLLLFAGSGEALAIQKIAGWVLYFYLMLYFLQFALYHSYEILRRLRVKERLTLELLALRKEQELATLKAQMNPHFLFNALNSISAMVSVDVEETRTMIAQLAALLRYATDSSQKEVVPLKEELQFLRDYITLEARRMGDRLSSRIDVEPSLAAYPVPPMVLQPLVENAIRHGIAPAEDGGSVSVSIKREARGVVFRVVDSGVGLRCADPLAKPDGVGLKNTDARLRKLFGESARLRITPGDGPGCEVTFTLPLR
jgi:two-component system, LytTR family, sensor kinase